MLRKIFVYFCQKLDLNNRAITMKKCCFSKETAKNVVDPLHTVALSSAKKECPYNIIFENLAVSFVALFGLIKYCF